MALWDGGRGFGVDREEHAAANMRKGDMVRALNSVSDVFMQPHLGKFANVVVVFAHGDRFPITAGLLLVAEALNGDIGLSLKDRNPKSLDSCRPTWGATQILPVATQVDSEYRVTHQVDSNLPLTSNQKFRFGLSKPGQTRPKRNF